MINFNKKRVMITIVVAILSISAISGYFLLNLKKEPKEEIKTVSVVYKKAMNAYLDKNATKETISEISSTTVQYTDDIPFIKDGFLNEVTFLEKNKDALSDYAEAREKYIESLHKKMKADFEFEKIKTEDITKRSKRYDIEYHGFQYMQYHMDLNRLTQMLLQTKYKNGDILNESLKFENEKLAEYQINTYKAKTKAMEILNSQLEKYESEEKFTTILYFEELDKNWSASNPLEIYNAFSGGQTKMTMAEHDKRFNKILNKAYNKYVDANKPFKLGKTNKKT